MNMRSTALPATVAITLSAGPAGAQDGLEIGVWAQPENAIYGEREWRQNVYPYIRWQKDRWKIDGDRASFDLLRAADGGWTFGPEVRVEFDGYEADESPLLTGMNLRADPVFAGASGQIELGWLELEAFAGHNVRDGGIEFLRLNSAIRHSPIVDAGSRTEGYVGILYRFH